MAMKAQPPTNLARNSQPREIGLLRSRSTGPGSNVTGIIEAVTSTATNTPATPNNVPSDQTTT